MGSEVIIMYMKGIAFTQNNSFLETEINVRIILTIWRHIRNYQIFLNIDINSYFQMLNSLLCHTPQGWPGKVCSSRWSTKGMGKPIWSPPSVYLWRPYQVIKGPMWCCVVSNWHAVVCIKRNSVRMKIRLHCLHVEWMNVHLIHQNYKNNKSQLFVDMIGFLSAYSESRQHTHLPRSELIVTGNLILTPQNDYVGWKILL